MPQKTIKFGIIGLGLMGREFASSVARWCHLVDFPVRPEIVAICDVNPGLFPWYMENFPAIKLQTSNYSDLICHPDVEAVFCAVPHHLHAEIYSAVIAAGKHLMGEKPFGIDLPANQKIMQAIAAHPESFVRCTSQFPFFPAVQRIGEMLESGKFGQIIEVNAGFRHSSDLDPTKPINWKRMIEINGEYGCLGDLGLHVLHLPLRAGWQIQNVRAILSNIVKQRPNARNEMVPCLTWDNATLFCEARENASPDSFPLTLKTQRIAPGEKNTWYLEIFGTRASARFSTKNPKRIEVLEYSGGEQVWQQIDMGHETAFKTITGGIFEFGFSDAILQMWAAFLYELHQQQYPKKFARCVTPAEAAQSHVLFTAALESQKVQGTVALPGSGD